MKCIDIHLPADTSLLPNVSAPFIITLASLIHYKNTISFAQPLPQSTCEMSLGAAAAFLGRRVSYGAAIS